MVPQLVISGLPAALLAANGISAGYNDPKNRIALHRSHLSRNYRFGKTGQIITLFA